MCLPLNKIKLQNVILPTNVLHREDRDIALPLEGFSVARNLVLRNDNPSMPLDSLNEFSILWIVTADPDRAVVRSSNPVLMHTWQSLAINRSEPRTTLSDGLSRRCAHQNSSQ